MGSFGFFPGAVGEYVLSSCPSGKISFCCGLCCVTGPCAWTQMPLILLNLNKGTALYFLATC